MGGGAGVVNDTKSCESNSRYIQMMNYLDQRNYGLVFDVIEDAVAHPKTAFLFDDDFRGKYEHFKKDFESHNKSDITDYHEFIHKVVMPFWDKIYKDGNCQLDDTYFTKFDTASLN